MEKPTLYQQYLKKYHQRNICITTSQIKDIVDTHYQQAKQNFAKLPQPRNVTQKAYISLWLDKEIIKDITAKNLIKVETKNSLNDLKEAINFFQNQSYQNLSPTTKKSVLTQASKDFIKVIKEKNIFAKNRGYKSYIDLRLDYTQISQKEYQQFLKSIYVLIKQSKKYLPNPKKLNLNQTNPCFICKTTPLPYKNIQSFIKIFSKKYRFLSQNQRQLNIKFSNLSSAEYLKETDTFQIEINQNIGLNHQIIDFLHELSHVKVMKKIFQQNFYINPNPYDIEVKVIENEVKLIKKYIPDMLIPTIKYMLTTIFQTLFEIKLFQNPNQNPDTLYSELLKQFAIYRQDIKNEYLFNKNILFKNLSQITYAIAYNKVLTSIFRDKIE